MDSKLAEFRRNQHLTLKEMAKMTGTSQTLYNKIEYCERKPSYEFIHRFYRAFPNVDIGWLFYANQDYIK